MAKELSEPAGSLPPGPPHPGRRYLIAPSITFGILLWVVFTAATSSSFKTAVVIGGDECYEVTKALLWSDGFKMYKDVWNNQPPLYTALLGICFSLFSPDILTARALALAFGILLAACACRLAWREGGMIASCVAVAALVVAPQTLKLSISAMLEVPAIAVALLSAVALVKWQSSKSPVYLILSGCFFALALQIKLTAAVVGPALVLEVLSSNCSTGSWRHRFKLWLNHSIQWGISIVVTFGLVVLVLGGSYEQMWASLFSEETARVLQTHKDFTFKLGMLLEHKEALLGLVFALGVLVAGRNWKGIRFPAVLLLTVLFIHLNHRPYWDYYYIHFGVPLALLSAFAAGELWKWSMRAQEIGMARTLVSQVSLSVLLAGTVWVGGWRFLSEMEKISSLPKIDDTELVNVMKRYNQDVKWVYTRDPICVFHAGLRIIPELSVLPENRFWSGRITVEEIWLTVEEYRPEMILIVEELGDAQELYLSENYRQIYDDPSHRLLVRKDIPSRDGE